jgi:DNA primase
VNTPETALFKKSKVLFGLDESRKRIVKERKALVVEGQIDALRLIYSGLDFVVAGQGTAFGQEHVHELIGLGILTAYLAFDSDKAGIQAAYKVGDLFQKEGVEVKIAILPPGNDPDLFIKERGPEAFLRLLDEAEDYLTFLVRYQAQGIDLQSPAGKNELAALLSKQIRNWQHPLMVHESLKKLAHQLQVPEAMLGVGQPAIMHHYLKKSDFAGHSEVDPDWVIETDVLRALLKAPASHPAVHPLAKERLQAAAFKVPICQTLFSLYREAMLAQKPIELLTFACQLDETEGQKLLEELSQKKVIPEKIDRFFVEALQKILDRNWIAEREAIRMQIQSGTHSDEEVMELAKKFEAIKRTPPQLDAVGEVTHR